MKYKIGDIVKVYSQPKREFIIAEISYRTPELRLIHRSGDSYYDVWHSVEEIMEVVE